MRSPKCPNSADPIGRATNAIANVASEESVADAVGDPVHEVGEGHHGVGVAAVGVATGGREPGAEVLVAAPAVRASVRRHECGWGFADVRDLTDTDRREPLHAAA